MVLPLSDQEFKEIALQRLTNEDIELETLYALFRVFEKELEVLRMLEKEKIALESLSRPGAYGLFKDIAGDKPQYIYPERIDEYMQNHDIFMASEDIHGIIKKLDRDRDGKISYLEFLDSFLPEYVKPYIKHNDLYKSEPSALPSEEEYEDRPLQVPEAFQFTTFIEIGTQTEVEAKMAKYETPKKSIALDESGEVTSKEQVEHASPLVKTPAPPLKESNIILTPEKNIKSPASVKTAPSITLKYDEIDLIDNELTYLFKEQIKIDEETEEAKIDLCNKSDFCLIDVFRYFDISGLGAITIFEIKKGFEDLQLTYNLNSLYLLMKHYDRDLDGKLNIGEFEKMLKPSLNFPPRIPRAKRGELVFMEQTVEKLKDVIILLLNAEDKVEYIRKRVSAKDKTGVFSIIKAFQKIDIMQKGYLFGSDVIQNISDC